MGGGLVWLGFLQVAIIFLMLIPILYWVRRSFPNKNHDSIGGDYDDLPKISLILPMRNESKNVMRKLDSIIPEIIDNENVELIVVDSDSPDDTARIAMDFLNGSQLDNARWSVENVTIVGKSATINFMLDKIDSDIIVISDADANVLPGWLEVVTERLSTNDIGVVSGIEAPTNSESDFFNYFYRRSSNFLRIQESRIDSTPVLEGSLLAWRVDALTDFRLNEKMNADDAQLGFGSIRRGKRSIIDPRISFQGFEGEKRSLKELVRRSQGLSLALLRNADLIFYSTRPKVKFAIFNALFLYVFFPWLFLIFCINSVIALVFSPTIINSWGFFSLVLIAYILTTKRGRSLIFAIGVSIKAHLQIIKGKRYSSWEPIR